MSDMPASQTKNQPVGYVVGGGLKENLRVRLTASPQRVQEGAFVVIDSKNWRFYGLVTDLQLGATDLRFADEQSEGRLSPELADLLLGQTLYTNLEVMPQLMMDRGPELDSPQYPEWAKTHADQDKRPLAVKTIPAHHAHVRMADAGDIAEVFGEPGKEGKEDVVNKYLPCYAEIVSVSLVPYIKISAVDKICYKTPEENENKGRVVLKKGICSMSQSHLFNWFSGFVSEIEAGAHNT